MSWRLAHEKHAIERVALTLIFVEPIPHRLWVDILDAATKSLPALGLDTIFDTPVVNIGIGQPNFAIPTGVRLDAMAVGEAHVGQPLGGRIFRSRAAPSAHEEINLSRDAFVYQTGLYNRWGDFKQRAFSLIGPSFDSARTQVDVRQVKLEYWDRFVFEGTREEVTYAGLLSADSPYLPRFQNEATSLWHAHIGQFVAPGRSARRLINLNIDALDLRDAATSPDTAATAQRSVGIYTLAQDDLRADGSSVDSQDINPTIDEMHAVLKEVFRQTVTDEIATRVSLYGELANET